MSSSSPKLSSRTAVIRTSDRISFKTCRRRWNWTSHLREHLGPKQIGDPLWLGSAMHFALEDFHGENKYGSPSRAIQAFAYAYRKKHPKRMPDEWRELMTLGIAMMEYYPLWLTGRNPLDTYVYKGVPQVEVNVRIPIPWDALEKQLGKVEKDKFKRIRDTYDEIVYSMQFDRVIQDDNKQLWLVEYKSAKQIQTSHYMVDPQVSAYVWGASLIYDKPVVGVIYQQHRKDLPKPPRVLQNGEVSTAQNQRTTHRLYRKTLIEVYGSVEKAPKENIRHLNTLATQESEDWDEYIRRDRVYRNDKSAKSLASQILWEVGDMLDPRMPLYPNPTRMCANFCPFLGPCVSMDDGSDWEYDLKLETERRTEEYDDWKDSLPDPKTFNPSND